MECVLVGWSDHKKPALRLLLLAGSLATAGCGARDCALGIGHNDCVAEGSPRASVPQDDVACRSYGLVPGTRDYAICRTNKQRVRTLTSRETDYGVLQEPLTPSVRY